MLQIRIGFLMVAVLVAVAGRAAAQQIPWEDRVFANISFGGQGGSAKDLSASRTFDLYEETASIDVTRSVKGGGSFLDLVVGGRVRGTFGAALGYFSLDKDSGGTLNASIPDLARFDRPRSVSLDFPDLRHRERWISLMAVWFHPLAEKLDLLVMAGPAFVSVENEQVDVATATVTETSGGPRVDVGKVVTKKTATGINVGADVRYLVIPNVGVGVFVRYAAAGVDVAGGNSLDLGGMQGGIGVRIRY